MTSPGWVYVFGTADGKLVRIGHTSSLRNRRAAHERGLGDRKALLLAAVRGSKHDERVVIDRIRAIPDVVCGGGRKTDFFMARLELVEWVNWLRTQYWTWTNEDEGPEEQQPALNWCPGEGRRLPLDSFDHTKLIQDWDAGGNGALTGTPWARLVRPLPPANDYYTPPDIVARAREGMGGIDLDAASHWYANRVLRHTRLFSPMAFSV